MDRELGSRFRVIAGIILGVWAMGGTAFAVEEDAAAQIAALRKEVAAVRADQQKTLEALDAIREQLRIIKMRIGKN